MSFSPFLLAITLFICSLPQVSYADESAVFDNVPAIKAPLASKSLLLDITKVGDRKLAAVGEHGHILLSSDAVNWQQANVPVQTTLTSVFFIYEQLGWAVGHD